MDIHCPGSLTLPGQLNKTTATPSASRAGAAQPRSQSGPATAGPPRATASHTPPKEKKVIKNKIKIK